MAKKILITGMNKAQCTYDHYLNMQLKIVPSHYALTRGLADMGWEVEQRPVELGEDLSHFDEVIIFFHNPSGFAGYVYNGLYALSQRPNAITAFDDWQIDSIYEGVKALEANLFRKYIVDSQSNSLTLLEKYETQFREAIKIIFEQKNRLMLSAFAGGDLGLLIDYPKELLFSYNPNPYHLNRKPGELYEAIKNRKENRKVFSVFDDIMDEVDSDIIRNLVKKHEWNFASLVQGKTKKWLKTQNPKWPINFYGSRKDGQDRLKEDEMCKVYEEQWGCLMPGYYHAGSGWWRARPLQVADAGSILICDDKEGEIYGEAYVGVTCEKIEALKISELIEFAQWQKDCLYTKHPLDKRVFQQELQTILDAK